jgi:hypothetical protein
MAEIHTHSSILDLGAAIAVSLSKAGITSNPGKLAKCLPDSDIVLS